MRRCTVEKPVAQRPAVFSVSFEQENCPLLIWGGPTRQALVNRTHLDKVVSLSSGMIQGMEKHVMDTLMLIYGKMGYRDPGLALSLLPYETKNKSVSIDFWKFLLSPKGVVGITKSQLLSVLPNFHTPLSYQNANFLKVAFDPRYAYVQIGDIGCAKIIEELTIWEYNEDNMYQCVRAIFPSEIHRRDFINCMEAVDRIWRYCSRCNYFRVLLNLHQDDGDSLTGIVHMAMVHKSYPSLHHLLTPVSKGGLGLSADMFDAATSKRLIQISRRWTIHWFA